MKETWEEQRIAVLSALLMIWLMVAVTVLHLGELRLTAGRRWRCCSATAGCWR